MRLEQSSASSTKQGSGRALGKLPCNLVRMGCTQVLRTRRQSGTSVTADVTPCSLSIWTEPLASPMVGFQLPMTDVTATTACHQTIRIVSTVILSVHMFHPVSRDGRSRDYQDAGGATSTSCTLELLHDLRHSAGHMGDRQTYETCYPFISWTEVLTNQTRKGKHSSMLGIKNQLVTPM